MNRVVLPILALLLLAAPALAQQGKVIGDPVRGEALARRWCAACHLVEGQGKTTDTAPPFRVIAHDPKKGPDYLRTFLAQPHKPMPPLTLSRQEIEDFVAYFGELKTR
jgi:mono/diheme cytochrome c family protein